MSHFTHIRTALVDRDALTSALDDLGIPWDGEPVRGYRGSTTRVDIRVPGVGPYDAGFVRTGGAYDLVGDFSMSGVKASVFLDTLKQRYAYHVTRTQLAEQGFELVEERAQEGRLHMVLRRMA